MVPHGAIVVSATQGNSAIVRGPDGYNGKDSSQIRFLRFLEKHFGIKDVIGKRLILPIMTSVEFSFFNANI